MEHLVTQIDDCLYFFNFSHDNEERKARFPLTDKENEDGKKEGSLKHKEIFMRFILNKFNIVSGVKPEEVKTNMKP